MVKIPEDKQCSPEDLGEPQSDDADDDDDNDSLLDLFSLWEPKKPKMTETKEDQDEEKTQTMDTDMPELISSNEEDTLQKKFTAKKPSWKKSFYLQQ